MRTKGIFTLLVITAAAITFGPTEAKAIISAQISTPNVSVSINGYMPAPPGVFIQLDAGRPYYIEREQRIYIKEKPAKHHGYEKNHHEDHGRKHGHDK